MTHHGGILGVTGEAGWAFRQIERHREGTSNADQHAMNLDKRLVPWLASQMVDLENIGAPSGGEPRDVGGPFFVTGARCGCNLQLVRSGTTPGPFEDARILGEEASSAWLKQRLRLQEVQWTGFRNKSD
ncbi:predicted protein [Histoplasma capsulatum H143]|uniref:Uncharacterized protein n=1 Tax=Ajellomyces capsulatus (strain H143) TaxID=544712 RepID=C6H607_AJECH|nr:predicted protein [Histoplasma capsulatum H143]